MDFRVPFLSAYASKPDVLLGWIGAYEYIEALRWCRKCKKEVGECARRGSKWVR